ncbi:MAG: NUDIX hydrolase, partial [Clostridia bacterium]
VVYKQEDGQLYFLMIEDRYGKRTLAKGKQEQGETLEQTALREVLEETGIKGQIVKPLQVIHYTYTHPQSAAKIEKEVHYYLIEATSGKVVAQLEEINEVHWRLPEAAWQDQQQKGYANNDSVLQLALRHFGVEV